MKLFELMIRVVLQQRILSDLIDAYDAAADAGDAAAESRIAERVEHWQARYSETRAQLDAALAA